MPVSLARRSERRRGGTDLIDGYREPGLADLIKFAASRVPLACVFRQGQGTYVDDLDPIRCAVGSALGVYALNLERKKSKETARPVDTALLAL